MTVDQAQRRKSMARWHRRLALGVSLWLAVLAATGFMINHAHDFGLDGRELPSTLQKLLYGIERADSGYCLKTADIGTDCSAVFTRIELPAGALLLSDSNLYLLDGEGVLLEKLAAGQLGLGSLQAGVRKGSHIYLRDAQSTLQTDFDLLDWAAIDTGAAAALNELDWQQRGQAASSISWERALLDLHAARFLGPAARWFNDVVAVLVLILAVSGIRLYRLKRNPGASQATGTSPNQ